MNKVCLSILSPLLLITAFATSSTQLHALIAGPYEVSGTIRSFDSDAVIIENSEAYIHIPREYVGIKKLVAGNKAHLALSAKQAQRVKSKQKRKP